MSTSRPVDPTAGGEGVKPKYRRSYSVYTDDNYVDQHGNRWLVRISGEARAVRAMVEKGHILLDAAPIDEESWKRAVEALQPEYRTERSDRAGVRELPSLETYALLIRSAEHPYWSIQYEIDVPYAGSSWHSHSVDVGDDSLAKVTFTADRSVIDVYMGADIASGLTGAVSSTTTNASIAMLVHENGTGYHFNGDSVIPPGA